LFFYSSFLEKIFSDDWGGRRINIFEEGHWMSLINVFVKTIIRRKADMR